MKNHNLIGLEQSEFTPVELVGYGDDEAGSYSKFRGWRFTDRLIELLNKCKSIKYIKKIELTREQAEKALAEVTNGTK